MNQEKHLLETIEKWKLDVMKAKEEIAILKHGNQVLKNSYLTCLEICKENEKEAVELQSDLSAARASNEKLREALLLFARHNHHGDCVFTDKADEGCYLCKEAINKNWHKVEAALAESEKGEE